MATAEPDPRRADEVEVDRSGVVVVGLFVVREVHGESLDVVVGEKLAGHVGDLLAIHDRTGRSRDRLVAAVLSVGRGGQAESERREGRVTGLQVGLPAEMVHLVEYDQPEPVTVARNVDVEAVVGGHRERHHLVVAPADEPDLVDVEGREKAVVPLAHQVQGRHDDQGRPVDRGDGQVGDV